MNANTLYYGDNLDILRRYVKDETVDLVYLDPPFNSKRDYNATFTDEHGISLAGFCRVLLLASATQRKSFFNRRVATRIYENS